MEPFSFDVSSFVIGFSIPSFLIIIIVALVCIMYHRLKRREGQTGIPKDSNGNEAVSDDIRMNNMPGNQETTSSGENGSPDYQNDPVYEEATEDIYEESSYEVVEEQPH